MVKNYHQMAVTCRASSEHPEMPQVVLLLKMPCDSTSWTGTQVANHSWPLALAKSWTGSRKLNAPMSRVLKAAPLILNERGSILTSTEKSVNNKADPPDQNPHCTKKSEPAREKGGPLTCSPYKQSGGSSRSSWPRPAFSLQREYLTVVAQGGPLGGSWSRLPWLSYTSKGRKPKIRFLISLGSFLWWKNLCTRIRTPHRTFLENNIFRTRFSHKHLA